MVYPVAAADMTYYLTVKYDNTSDKAFTNVKLKLTLYGGVTNFTSIIVTPIAPDSPQWAFAGGAGNVVYIQTVTGINVAANASGELVFQLKVACVVPGTLDANLSAVVAVQP
jgi:hypothetical protein